MNSFFSGIIDWFKTRFNIKTQEKPKASLQTDFFDTEKPSVTATIAERLTSLTIADSEINIAGENNRAKYMDDVFKVFNYTKLQAVSEACLGTGDCIVRPNTDGKRIGFDIITNENFEIIDETGDFIYSILIKCDELVKGTDVFERWEKQEYVDEENVNYVKISQYCFKNGKQIEITNVPAWADLKEVQVVPNTNKLLFGRFKCPKVNRFDINSANGVPITSGVSYLVEETKKSFERFNEEFESSKKFTFADRMMFKKKKVTGANGETRETTSLPKEKENVIMTVNGSRSVDGSPLIYEFNPSIRANELKEGIETNFRLIELFCGLDSGILSKSEQSYENLDATRKSVQNTFAFICKLRSVLENGLKDLADAVNVICNANEVTTQGSYTLDVNWSDSFVENYADRFNQLLQSNAIGAVKLEEVRAWVMDEPLEVAVENVGIVDEEEIE